ncbi:MAG: TerB family tellurite resistance protein [Parvibaculales bacterium]
MSIWGKIAGAVAGAYVAGPVGAVAGAVAGHLLVDKELERDVAFTIALIALSAKMAKSDGIVSPAEVNAFYQICRVPDREQKNVERVYKLAQEDVAGFEVYARQVKSIFRDNPRVCEDVLDGLFHIAYSDGDLHPAEEDYLKRVSDIFGLDRTDFDRIHAHHNEEVQDPYAVLGVAKGAKDEAVREAWLRAVRDNHPDQLQARGVPQEIIHLSNARMASINNAWEIIRRERGI